MRSQVIQAELDANAYTRAMASITRAGVRLHHVEAGSGDPPFVFVHGWCCDHTFFQPQFDLFKASHRVMAMDLRGCGESDKPAEGYDIPTLTDDVAALCRELGMSNIVLIGHSLGGMIGVEMAARHPSLVGAVVAVDPGPITITPESRAILEALLAGLEGPDGVAVRRTYVDDMFLPTDDANVRRKISETMNAVPMEIAAAVIRGAIEWNGVGALKLGDAPVLVISSGPGGSNDPARLRAARANVQIGITIGAGHFIQFDARDQVNAMIERFMQNLS